MATADTLDRGRASFGRRAWADAFGAARRTTMTALPTARSCVESRGTFLTEPFTTSGALVAP